MKVYKYDPTRYMMGVIIPTYFAAGVLVYALIQAIIGNNTGWFVLISIFCASYVLDNLIADTRPKEISDDGEYLCLRGFGKEHVFKWDEIKKLRIRQYTFTKKIYIRIGETTIVKGRYWLDLSIYSSGDEILQKFKKYEDILNPILMQRKKNLAQRTMMRKQKKMNKRKTKI